MGNVKLCPKNSPGLYARHFALIIDFCSQCRLHVYWVSGLTENMDNLVSAVDMNVA
jgi:hypothetical protein